MQCLIFLYKCKFCLSAIEYLKGILFQSRGGVYCLFAFHSQLINLMTALYFLTSMSCLDVFLCFVGQSVIFLS